MAIQTLGLYEPERTPVSEKRDITGPFTNPELWSGFGGAFETEAGEAISDATAMQISTVFSCVRILAESVASLPLRLFTVTPQGRTVETAHPLNYLLTIAPNEESTTFSLIETMVAHLALTGNCYVQIQRAADGSPAALWNLQPRLTEPYRLPSGQLAYKTTDGQGSGAPRILAAKDVLHVPLTSWDGLCGLSPIMQARRTLGMSIASEKYGARLFGNSAVPTFVMTHTAKIKPEDKVRMRQDWEMLQSGRNQHRIAIVDDGLSFQKMGLTNDEAQFLQLRQYTRADIAALFRVPVHMVGELQKLSNSNTENMNLSFVVDVLRPYLSRIEAEITKKLLPREVGKLSNLQVLFDTTERQRGDFVSQNAGYQAGRYGGWLTGNDVRRSMGLNDAGPELDVYLNPVNMENATDLLNQKLKEKLVPDAA